MGSITVGGGVKKLGRIPEGGGWKTHGRGHDGHYRKAKTGYAYLHAAVDDHTRLACIEALDDEKAVTAIGFLQRTVTWFNTYGIDVHAVKTDIHTGSWSDRAVVAQLVAWCRSGPAPVRRHC